MSEWHEKDEVTHSTSPNAAPELNIAKAHIGYELRRRMPWIFLSVAAGIAMVWIGQSYEEMLSARINLIFFIPMIVYMSDCIGTETLALFVRELSLRRLKIRHLIVKEALVGLSLGVAGGVPMGIVSYLWFNDLKLAIVVASAMIINGAVAVLIGMLLPIFFAKLGRDPAVGTEEIGTAISDNLSMLIYLLIATAILFGV